jgi:hypothetical protein
LGAFSIVNHFFQLVTLLYSFLHLPAYFLCTPKKEGLDPLDSKNREAMVARIKREIATSNYKIKSLEIAEKIGQIIRDDLPLIQTMKGFK